MRDTKWMWCSRKSTGWDGNTYIYSKKKQVSHRAAIACVRVYVYNEKTSVINYAIQLDFHLQWLKNQHRRKIQAHTHTIAFSHTHTHTHNVLIAFSVLEKDRVRIENENTLRSGLGEIAKVYDVEITTTEHKNVHNWHSRKSNQSIKNSQCKCFNSQVLYYMHNWGKNNSIFSTEIFTTDVDVAVAAAAVELMCIKNYSIRMNHSWVFMPSLLPLLMLFIYIPLPFAVCMCTLHVRWIYDFAFDCFTLFGSVFPWQVRRFLFGRICFSNYHLIRFVAVLLNARAIQQWNEWKREQEMKRVRERECVRERKNDEIERKKTPPLSLSCVLCGVGETMREAKDVNHMLKTIITLIERIGIGNHNGNLYKQNNTPNHYSPFGEWAVYISLSCQFLKYAICGTRTSRTISYNILQYR